MSKKSKILIVFTALLFSANLHASSFSCLSIQEEIDRVDLVAIGEIVFHELDPWGVGNIKFKLLRQWKGEPLETMEVHATQGFPFRFGESGYYMIFANWATHTDEPSWQIPPCLPLSDVVDNSEVFEILGEPEHIVE